MMQLRVDHIAHCLRKLGQTGYLHKSQDTWDHQDARDSQVGSPCGKAWQNSLVDIVGHAHGISHNLVGSWD